MLVQRRGRCPNIKTTLVWRFVLPVNWPTIGNSYSWGHLGVEKKWYKMDSSNKKKSVAFAEFE